MSGVDGLAENWRDGSTDDRRQRRACERCGSYRPTDYDARTGLYLCDPCERNVTRRRLRR